MATGIFGVLAHETLCAVLDFLSPMEVYVVARQVSNKLLLQVDEYYWKWRKDTACVAGMRLNAWFGGCTRMCRCTHAGSCVNQVQCVERLHSVTTEDCVWWHTGFCRTDCVRCHQTGSEFVKVAWAGPVVDQNLPPRYWHTVVVCHNGDVGVLGNSPNQGWLMHPVHNPNILRMLNAAQNNGAGRLCIRKCVKFASLFVGVLCGRHMIIIRLCATPVVYAKWIIGTSIAVAVDVAVCDQTQTVFSACSSGVLCVQKYKYLQHTDVHPGSSLMGISKATPVLENRSVRMVAKTNAAGVVLVRDYCNPRLLKLLKLQDCGTMVEIATATLPRTCVVVQLVALRFGRGVGVVCQKSDDTRRMCWWIASGAEAAAAGTRAVKLTLRMQDPGWHACPDGRLVDVGPKTEHPMLVAGGGMLWPTGDYNMLLVQPGTNNVPRRVLAPWCH